MTAGEKIVLCARPMAKERNSAIKRTFLTKSNAQKNATSEISTVEKVRTTDKQEVENT